MWKLRILNPITQEPLYESEGITLTKIYKQFKKEFPNSDFITIPKMRNIHGGRNRKDRKIIKVERIYVGDVHSSTPK